MGIVLLGFALYALMRWDLSGRNPAFCLLAFMYAVKNGYHVQLGVSLSRNIKTALLQSWACKRKNIFCQSLCSLNCVAWLYINFSNPAFWFMFTLFKSPKTSKPRGRKFTASDGSWAHEFGETHKCAYWLSFPRCNEHGHQRWPSLAAALPSARSWNWTKALEALESP